MCLLLPASGAFAAALSLEVPASAYIGSTFTVNVKVDNTAQLAGAAFTVGYDTSVLELISTDDKITSSFFDTFANQFAGKPCSPNCPTDADGVDQPLVSNTVTDPAKLPGTGTRLAAARVEPEAAPTSNTTIVSLKLKFIKGAAVAGTSYPISIKPTYLDNAAAGYTTGQYIPLLVGYAAGAQVEFPTLLERADGTAENTVPVLAEEPTWNLDIDGNNKAEAYKDGILVMRYLLDYPNTKGDAWINGAYDASGSRNTSAAIKDYIANNIAFLDIDGNNKVEAYKDGILVMRYLLDYPNTKGDAWINGAYDASGSRNTSAAIKDYILSIMP